MDTILQLLISPCVNVHWSLKSYPLLTLLLLLPCYIIGILRTPKPHVCRLPLLDGRKYTLKGPQ